MKSFSNFGGFRCKITRILRYGAAGKINSLSNCFVLFCAAAADYNSSHTFLNFFGEDLLLRFRWNGKMVHPKVKACAFFIGGGI